MKLPIYGAGLLLAALVCTGCPGQGDAILGNTNPRVKLVNANGGGQVDATINDGGQDVQVLNNATFGAVSQPTIVNNGQRVVTFRDAQTNAIISTVTHLFELNRRYTVVGYGPVGANNQIILQSFASPAQGSAAVRFAHAASGPDPVDIYVSATNEIITQGQQIANNLDAGTGTDYIGVTPGQRRFYVTGSSNQVPTVTQDFGLEANKKYTIVLGENPAHVLVLVDENDTL